MTRSLTGKVALVTGAGIAKAMAAAGALGAQRWRIARLILKRAVTQVTVGFFAGLLCTVVWTRLFWTGVERGLVTIEMLAMVATVLILLALTASLVPVLRATRLDPVAALRHE